MPSTARSKSLDLIRWLNGGHSHTAKKLASVTNPNYLSQMARGDMEITDSDARSIEINLGLPNGWMDRDHVGFMQSNPLDWDIYTHILTLSDNCKKGLLTFLEALKVTK